MLALMTIAAGEARAQRIYLELVGDKGPISALSMTPGHASETPILALAGNVYVEDLAAMQLSKRPIRLEKEQDGSSPRLLEALTTFEGITTCVIRFVDDSPAQNQFFQIDFTNPVLVGLTASGSEGGGPAREVVSIGYDAISYTYIPVMP